VTIFASILVPLDGSATAARSLGCATWLASRLGARLHLLSATPRELPAPEELRRLHVPEVHWPIVELHQAAAYPADAILAAVDRYDAGLVVMTARGSAIESQTAPRSADLVKIVGHVTQAVLEQCTVPVLLLPTRYQEVLPWHRLLVPVSGGTESDQAVATSVCLAGALDLVVDVAHVTDDGASRGEALAARARYSDALHHEYGGQLEELVARAIPTLAADQRRRIRRTSLGRGDVAGELLDLVRRDPASVLVVGWHGRLAAGRAEILKQLLPVLDVPVLLVRSEAPAPFRLNVGAELE
jgi:nucleotide-binding universal stress UspA family protein